VIHTFEIYLVATSFIALQDLFKFEVQQTRSETLLSTWFGFYQPTPSNAGLNIEYILNASVPVWLTVSGVNLVADGVNAPVGKYTFSLIAKDTDSGLTKTVNMLINVRRMVPSAKDVNVSSGSSYSNCAWGAIDNQLVSWGQGELTKCCYASATTTGSWWNLLFPHPKVIDSVLLMNRDDANDYLTVELRAGNDPWP